MEIQTLMPLKLYTISHDREHCIGCGSCELEAPHTWTLQIEDGLSLLKNSKNKRGTWVGEIDEFDLEDNKRALSNCPMQIIRIDEQG